MAWGHAAQLPGDMPHVEYIARIDALLKRLPASSDCFILHRRDHDSAYKTYLEVYNELKAAYNELWDEESMKLFGVHYSEDLPRAKKEQIKDRIPFVLSEAEPTAFGEEAK